MLKKFSGLGNGLWNIYTQIFVVYSLSAATVFICYFIYDYFVFTDPGKGVSGYEF